MVKFYVTDQDKRRAKALSKEIEDAQSALWELIAEARNSGAAASLGFSTWGQYAEQTFDTTRLRMSAVNAAMDGRDAPRLSRVDSPHNTAIIDFIRANPGCVVADVEQAVGVGNLNNRITRLRDRGIVKYEGKTGRAFRLWLTESNGA